MRPQLLPTNEITLAEARRLESTKWWDGHEPMTVALSQARQARICMPFGEFKIACEKALGELLTDSAFASQEGLIRMLERHDAGVGGDALDATWTKKPQYETRTFEEHLVHVAEEAAELAMEALTLARMVGKIQRFGLDHAHPDTPDATNRANLWALLPKVASEAADLRLAAARLFARLGETP